ncbi:MAG: PEGA domain-containing protein [Spirochaetales bacterium]|nr:PEGA domain-containing protein [Spirochaetales bacterium]
MRAAALLPVLLLVQGLGLNAQAAGADAEAREVPPEFMPTDSEEHWTVAIARFQGVDLSRGNLYLTHSLPLLLRESISDIRSHFFAAEERLGYQQWIVRQEQRRLGQALQDLRKQRDELFFQELTTSERAERLAQYDGQIAELVERINLVRSVDPARVDFPESKPIRLYEPGAAGSDEARGAGSRDAFTLIDTPVLSPLKMAREKGVNLLVWGTLEEIQGYLYLEVRALDANLGREVFYYSDAAAPEELHGGLAGAAADLSRVLWGRDWAALSVDAVPAGAEVYVEGAYMGRAPVRVEYLVPGPVEVRVRASGHRSETLRLELPPYTETRERIVLEERAPDPLGIASEPAGASVYDGSTWLGTTPLSVQHPRAPSRVVLRLEGYPERIVYLTPDTDAAVSVSFSLAESDPKELQTRRRNAFYTSFGIFALSVPLPAYFWGAASDSAAAYQLAAGSGNLTEAFRLAEQVDGYWNAYAVTLGVSGALLVNAVIHLVRYMIVADRRG